MTTTAQRRASAKRDQITAAARRLFLANGYAGTSMDAVVAEAGVSKQTLYRYFASKADLLAAILATEITLTGFFPPERPELHTVADLRALLLRISRTVTTQIMSPENMAVIRLVFGEAFRIPELRDGLRDALPGQLLRSVTELLSHADALGLISTPRPDLSARLFVGPVFSFVALDGFLRVEPLAPPSLADLEVLVDIFLTAVEVPR